MPGMMACHLGAGTSSLASQPEKSKLLENALLLGQRLLLSNASSCDITASVLSYLEVDVNSYRILKDSGLTNAGRGSNRTILGTVECEASMMTSKGEFAAVGCLKRTIVISKVIRIGIQNPSQVVNALLKDRNSSSYSMGRIPPL